MKHAILILAHNHLDYLSELIDDFDDDFYIYIHIDKKKSLSKKDILRLSQKKNVVLISQKYKVNWGGHSIIKAEIFLLKEALKKPDTDYFHLISGQDIPTKNIKEFKRFFQKNKGKEFLEYESFPQDKWDNGTFARFQYFRLNDIFNERSYWGHFMSSKIIQFQQKHNILRKIPNQFDLLYGGSEWFSLTRRCVEHIINYTQESPAFFKKLKYTFASDETYINTVVLHSPFKDNVENNNLRYIVWEHRNNSFPANLDETDFFNILSSYAFFARKIAFPVSEKLLEKLLYYRTFDMSKETKGEDVFCIASTGYWENKDFRGHCYDKEIGETLCGMLELMEVKTVVDFGCGPGWYVKALQDAGFVVKGYDGNPYVRELSNIIFQGEENPCGQLDLTKEIKLDKRFDAVISLEVGEHIPEAFEDIYIQNLVNNSNKYIIMSWAIDGQKGDGHINCRSNDYIIDKITKYGLIQNLFAQNYLRNVAELLWFKETIVMSIIK